MNSSASADLWFRLLYRGLIRMERRLDRALGNDHHRAELKKLAGELNEATERLKKAMESQGKVPPQS